MKKISISLLLSSTAFALQTSNPESCTPTYCLGPAITQGNAPVRPYTCDGDLEISASALYWKASQDGMEYAYKTNVRGLPGNYPLVDAEYLSPNFQWEPGFRIGLSYCSPCDGWDVGAVYTTFNGRGFSQENILEFSGSSPPFQAITAPTNNTIVLLWSGVAAALRDVPFVGKVETEWNSNIKIGDLVLGRSFWTSPRLELRPNVGIRLLSLDQKFTIFARGGYWQEFEFATMYFEQFQPAMNGEMKFKNTFEGVGCKGGLDASFHLSCGWSIYGEMAASIIYGRFEVQEEENVRLAQNGFPKVTMVETKNHFRASRAVLDTGLGVQWFSLVSNSKYGVTVQLGFEQHLFFHQNQFWRVNRVNKEEQFTTYSNDFPFFPATPNNTGDNIHFQQRGTLSTNGLTFTFKFDF